MLPFLFFSLSLSPISSSLIPLSLPLSFHHLTPILNELKTTMHTSTPLSCTYPYQGRRAPRDALSVPSTLILFSGRPTPYAAALCTYATLCILPHATHVFRPLSPSPDETRLRNTDTSLY